VLIWYLNTNSI